MMGQAKIGIEQQALKTNWGLAIFFEALAHD
jgi:hypothetical protein